MICNECGRQFGEKKEGYYKTTDQKLEDGKWIIFPVTICLKCRYGR